RPHSNSANCGRWAAVWMYLGHPQDRLGGIDVPSELPRFAYWHEYSTEGEVMLVRFWGGRGSTATPQPENLRYGGNTSCVEVRVNGHIYIFYCGTGVRNLGNELQQETHRKPPTPHHFPSHLHSHP